MGKKNKRKSKDSGDGLDLKPELFTSAPEETDKGRGDGINAKIEENTQIQEQGLEVFPEEEIRKYARDFFNRLYSDQEQSDNHDRFDDLDEVQHKLSILSGCEKGWVEERRYIKNFREATRIFLEEFLAFSQEKRNDKNIHNFLEKTREILFSSSPHIASALSFREHFDFASKATRAKSLPLGPSLMGELAYEIDWNYNPESGRDGLLESYNTGSLPEKLDKLNLIQVIYAELIVNAHRHGDEKIIKLLDKIKQANENAFIGYYINIVEEKLGQEYENPSKGIMRYTNDLGNNRLWERLTSEQRMDSEKLEAVIIANRSLERGEKIIKIADNVVGILDHTNRLIEYAEVDLTEMSNKGQLEISATYFNDIKAALAEKTSIIMRRFIDASNDRILSPFNNIENNDPNKLEKLAAIWEKLDHLTKEEWKEYFELNLYTQELTQKVRDFEREEFNKTEDKNIQATIKLFDKYQKELPSIINNLDNQALKRAYEEFGKAYEAGDFEHAFEELDRLRITLKFLVNIKDKDPSTYSKIEELVEAFNSLQDMHSANWNDSRSRVDAYYNDLSIGSEERILRFSELLQKIEGDRENICSNFEKEMDVIWEAIKEDKLEAEFMNFDEFMERNMPYLKNIEIKEAELLFQHLYRPAMRERIENEFGIRLDKLSLHYHVPFLKFLSEKNIEEAEKVREFLNQAEDERGKINRIKSFLSLEAGEEMGEKIFEISESLDQESADMVFVKYAEIVDLAYKHKETVSDLFVDNISVSPEELELVAQSGIKKANELLINFSERIKRSKEKDRQLIREEILSELEEYKTDLIFETNVLGTLKKGARRADIKPEDLRGIRFEKTTARQVLEGGNVAELIDFIRKSIAQRESSQIPGTLMKGLLGDYVKKHNLSEEEKTSVGEVFQMLNIYSRNYEDNPKLQKKLLESFLDKLEKGSDKVRIYFYQKNREILAFNLFDSRGEGRKYFGSFNVRPEIAGSTVGGALLSNSLEEETVGGQTIKADCLPGVTITSGYIERWGFVVKKIVRDYQGTGETVFSIERLPGQTEYQYKDYGPEKLILEAEYSAGEQKDGGSMVLKFKTNSPELIDVSEELINGKGYVMTRYFFDKENVYCAFEKGGN